MSDKKYPWIKSIFKKKRPAEGVYAGPEMMKNAAPGEDEKCETEPVDVVYGGPDMIKKPEDPQIVMPEPDKPVYAGPEFFAPEAPVREVYAGPRDLDRDAPLEDVYAGPEPLEEPEDPEEDAGEPEAKADDADAVNKDKDEARRDRVRAADPRMFMTVYAGPDYFAGKKPNVGAFAFPAAQNGDKKKIFCPYCGTPNAEENKFCTEWASPIRK